MEKTNAILKKNNDYLYWNYYGSDSYNFKTDTSFLLSKLCCSTFKISYMSDCSKFMIYLDPTN